MPAYPFDPSPLHWNPESPRYPSGSFRPYGKLEQHGPHVNPDLWDSKKTMAARLIVGFSVGDTPTWGMEDLIRLVRSIRERQVGDPSATFVAQRGIYKHHDASKGVVEEQGAQVFIINLSKLSLAKFRKQMTEMAEEICRAFEQESIIVEIQINGISQITIGVGP